MRHTVTPMRVVRVLEGLSELHDPGDEDKFASMVYRFCHLASSTCKEPHEDWQKEFLQLEIEVLNSFNVSPNEREKRNAEIAGMESVCEL